MKIIMAEKIFDDTKEAFKFFIKEIYPDLKPEDKNKIKKTKYDFVTQRVKVSEAKLEEVLKNYANAEIQKSTKIIFK